MSGADQPVRIFVGADRSQRFAVQVLEHSIRRHASLPVELSVLPDLGLPEPEDPRLRQRTGFSFARFAIPELAGRTGRAIYLDADMLVFRDIAELWSLPFRGAKLICQEEPPQRGRPRARQTSVMVLDCAALDWDAAAIVGALGRDYDYAALMSGLCILRPEEVGGHVPTRWNSLEHYDETTALLHYTDMPTQPWVCPSNPNGWLWTREVRDMLADGSLAEAEIAAEIDAGYMRPSFLTELGEADVAGPAAADAQERYARIDREAGFEPHVEVMAAHRALEAAIRACDPPPGLPARLRRAAGRLVRSAAGRGGN